MVPCSSLTSPISFSCIYTQPPAGPSSLGSSGSCQISYDMLPEVKPVAHRECRDVSLTVGCLFQGAVHQGLSHCTNCKAQGTLAGPVWVLQCEAQRETAATSCFLCWADLHAAQISGLWVRALGLWPMSTPQSGVGRSENAWASSEKRLEVVKQLVLESEHGVYCLKELDFWFSKWIGG